MSFRNSDSDDDDHQEKDNRLSQEENDDMDLQILIEEVQGLGEVNNIQIVGYSEFEFNIDFTIKGQEGKWCITVGGTDDHVYKLCPLEGWNSWKKALITVLYKSPDPVECNCLAKDRQEKVSYAYFTN